jgi:hypothetical protein
VFLLQKQGRFFGSGCGKLAPRRVGFAIFDLGAEIFGRLTTALLPDKCSGRHEDKAAELLR